MAWTRGETPAPVTVEWDLSNRCVLGCQDCHFAHTHVRGPWAMRPRVLPMAFESTGDLADTSLVMSTLEDMLRHGVRSIVWSGGGEPTTHPDWLLIVGHAKWLGLRQGMYTCGGLLNKEHGGKLGRAADWVVVSLDAPDATSYAAEKGVTESRFDAAVDGIRNLVGHSATVGVSFLLHADNWTRCKDMLALSRSLGATYTTFRPAVKTSPDRPSVPLDTSWIALATDRTYRTVLQQVALEPDVEMDMERFRAYGSWNGHGYDECSAIQLHTTITPDGRVWVCPQRRGVTAIGDLRVESFDEIWGRHPRSFSVDEGCRAMCRLHPVNEAMVSIRAPRAHEAFI